MYKHVIQPPQVKNLGYASPSNIMLTQYFYFSNSCKKKSHAQLFFWCLLNEKD